MMQAADNSGVSFAQVMPRPKTFENRQFNVKNIGDNQELDPANFSTGDDMERRLTASLRTAQEDDPDDFDFRPKIDGMRVNENPNYPALSHNDMNPRLKYPYPKDANNPGDFAGSDSMQRRLNEHPLGRFFGAQSTGAGPIGNVALDNSMAMFREAQAAQPPTQQQPLMQDPQPPQM